MLSDERLAAIRARLAAATPGPWVAHQACNPNPYSKLLYMKWEHWIERDVDEAHFERGTRLATTTTIGSWANSNDTSANNAAFIAAAPTDIRDLLDEIERLKRIETAARELCDPSFGDSYHIPIDRVRLLDALCRAVEASDGSSL